MDTCLFGVLPVQMLLETVLSTLAVLLRNTAKVPLNQKFVMATESLSLSATRGVVNQITVQDLSQILKGDERSLYQILDVREPDELEVARISGEDIVNLPLGSLNAWSNKVQNGDLLDSTKPTICFCHHGGRSMKVASILGKMNHYSSITANLIATYFGLFGFST